MIQNYKKFFLLKLLHALTELLNQCRSGITDVYKKHNVDLINLLKQVKCDIESCNTIGTNLEHLGGPHTPDCIHEISEIINNLYQILDEVGNLYVDIKQEISAIRILIEDIEHLILNIRRR